MNNSGDDLWLDVDMLYSQVPSVRHVFEREFARMRRCAVLHWQTTRQRCFRLMSVFSYQQINLPMSYALFLQRFTAAASGIVQVTSFGPDDDPYMEMNVRPIVVDRYDFPADAAPGATGPLVDSEELRMLHDYGLAQEFDIWGVGSTHEFSWNGFHERATLESSIDFEKAPRFVDTHNLGNRATEPLNDLDLGTTPVDTNW